MKRKYFFYIFYLVAININLVVTSPNEERFMYDKYKIIEVAGIDDFTSEEALFTKLDLPLDEHVNVLHEDAVEGKVHLLIKPELVAPLLEKIETEKLGYQIMSEDVSEQLRDLSMLSVRTETPDSTITFSSFMKLEAITAHYKNISKTFSGKVRLSEIGTSFEGRPIHMISITNYSRRSKGSTKPIIFIEGGVHAREWISPATCLYVIENLLKSPRLIRDIEWRIVPVSNPDGYVHTWNSDRFWRKNRRRNENKKCSGVDLNRNFGTFFNRGGSSSRPCSGVYHGPYAFSESEAEAIQRAIRDGGTRIKAYISVHCYGQYILYPPGITFHQLPADILSEMRRVAKRMADAIYTNSKTVYTTGQPGRNLYAASGLSMDWAHIAAKIPFSYTFEMRDKGWEGFLLSASKIEEAATDLWVALDVMVEEVLLLDQKASVGNENELKPAEIFRVAEDDQDIVMEEEVVSTTMETELQEENETTIIFDEYEELTTESSNAIGDPTEQSP